MKENALQLSAFSLANYRLFSLLWFVIIQLWECKTMNFKDVKPNEAFEKEIADIIEDGDGCRINVTRGIRELWFRGDEDTELRLVFQWDLKLIISRVAFKNKRCGTMSKILNILISFCKENGVKEIETQCVETKAMANFCIKHGFTPDLNASIQIKDADFIIGNYKLAI